MAITPLRDKQEVAVVSYSPKKPGRPPHNYYNYLMAGLRLVMGVEVKAGNEHACSHMLPGLLRLLDEQPSQTDRRSCATIVAWARTALCARARRGRSRPCSSGASQRISNAALSVCSGFRAGAMLVRAGNESTARWHSLQGEYVTRVAGDN